MTIIAAASWGKKTWIACDRAGTDGWGTQANHGTKLCKTPFGWLGFTASYRTIQVLYRRLRTVESVSTADDLALLSDAIQGALKDAGWSMSSADTLPKCSDLCLLIATWDGRLFTVQSDLAILESRGFAAIGSGYQVALGAMNAAKTMGADAENGVTAGVRAACKIISSCAGPVAPVEVR